MSKETDLEEIQHLRRLIAKHEDLYRRQHAPEISDFEFDELVARLRKLEGKYQEHAGPELGIGDDRSEGFQQRDHREPMLSLDNTYDEGDFRAFGERLQKALGTSEVDFVVEPKVDGVALSLTYERGRFVRAVTRGNGNRGDDVTHNIALIESLPRELADAPELLEIRGEVYMELAEFQRLNAEREAEGEALYANPRNLAAGTVKLLDHAEARKRRLSVLCYGLGACEPPVFASLSDFKRRLTKWGFPTRDDIPVQHGIEAAWAAIQKLDSLRRELPFPTDGAVVKVDRLADQQKAGRTSKFPHWAVAFKFPPDRADTVLRAITMQVGRTGAITPVAELEPVLLAGSTVARATLHNAGEIARKDIREGDTVRIQKAGEIIPQVLEVVLAKRPAEAVPFDFEARLKELGLDAVRVGDEAAYKLRAPSREMKIRRLIHFACKQCLDIDGLGEAVAEQLVDLGLVDAPVDVLKLNRGEWMMVEGFKEKSVDNMLAGLAQAKQRELCRHADRQGPRPALQVARRARGRPVRGPAPHQDRQERRRHARSRHPRRRRGSLRIHPLLLQRPEPSRLGPGDARSRAEPGGSRHRGRRRGRRRQDLCPDGHLAHPGPRRSARPHREGRRQGQRKRQQEDRLRRRGRGSWLEAHESPGTRRPGARRGRPAEATRVNLHWTSPSAGLA
jgi:DNA ligase (NAD+)